jgi:hypothetical protein
MDISFPIPEGMVPPEGSEEGATFDALATVKLGKDTLTLIAIDGLPVSEGEEAPEAEAADDAGFDATVMSGLKGTAGMEE